MNCEKLASFFIRIGLALVFGYAAIASFISPDSWLGYFPRFLRDLIAPNILLVTFSLFELILTLWLLSGKKQFHAGIVSSIVMAAIIMPNIAQFDIIFRDIAILFMGLTLATLHSKRCA